MSAPPAGRHRVTDVEADPGAAEVAVVRPRAVTTHLIVGIETTSLDETGSPNRVPSKCRPSTDQPQAQMASADHVRQGLEGSPSAELQGGAYGVAYRQPKETSSESLTLVHRDPEQSNGRFQPLAKRVGCKTVVGQPCASRMPMRTPIFSR